MERKKKRIIRRKKYFFINEIFFIAQIKKDRFVMSGLKI